jgi:hypothetical protein
MILHAQIVVTMRWQSTAVHECLENENCFILPLIDSIPQLHGTGSCLNQLPIRLQILARCRLLSSLEVPRTRLILLLRGHVCRWKWQTKSRNEFP